MAPTEQQTRDAAARVYRIGELALTAADAQAALNAGHSRVNRGIDGPGVLPDLNADSHKAQRELHAAMAEHRDILAKEEEERQIAAKQAEAAVADTGGQTLNPLTIKSDENPIPLTPAGETPQVPTLAPPDPVNQPDGTVAGEAAEPRLADDLEDAPI